MNRENRTYIPEPNTLKTDKKYKVIKISGEKSCVTHGLVVGEIIDLPDDRFKYADDSHCNERYFDHWPEYFEALDGYND
jgi:hypothetical protein